MPTWLLLTTLLASPGDAWSPADAPPPTPWARAGARGWRACGEAELQARAVRNDGRPRGEYEEGVWARRAEQCPHAVELLTLAALAEIVETGTLFARVDTSEQFGTRVETLTIDEMVEVHRLRIGRALRWLETAIAESARRGIRPPREALYYRAYALTALGRVQEARKAIDEAIAAGDVQRWRSERMAAIIELLAGNTKAALRRAQRGVNDAPPTDRRISRYIRAYVLDRAGAPARARTELIVLRRETGESDSRDVMETVLPIHERLFFRALDHQAQGNASPALRMWEMYLARPEPAEPERVLAQRHLDELTPSPAPVEGP
ncbi:MAG: hypothetical protein AAF799_08375 [Myxococcota bacterium]